MKPFRFRHLYCLLLFIGILVIGSVSNSKAATRFDFYVSPSGKDSFPGTVTKPFRTIDRARIAVRSVNGNMSNDIHVFLRGGTYWLTAPITFQSSDSGSNGHTVAYEAYRGEAPFLNGGVQVTGWTFDHDGIYKAPLSRNIKLRALFVNGIRAEMTSKTVQGQGADGTFVVAGTEPWAESPGSGPDGIKFKSDDVGLYANPDDIELDQQYTWNASIVGVRNIVQDGDSTVFQMQQPAGVLAASMGYGTGLNPTAWFTIRNAKELLEAPGQFYFDRAAQTVYYYSRGEDMAKATVIAPTSEGLIKIAGQSLNKRVMGLAFKGLTFEFDDWQLMVVAGSHQFAATQSGAMTTKFLSGRSWHEDKYNACDVPPGAIDVRSASRIAIDQDRFLHLGSGSAVCFVNDVDNSEVVGNTFYDLAGNAVMVGHPQHVYTDGSSTLFPIGVLGVCTNDTVSDNLLRNVSNDYHQLEGIAAFYVNGLKIEHNDIAETPYGAIALGWGWSNQPKSTTCRNNTIAYNRIVDANRILRNDGGPIYTLGQQPNSQIIGNYVKNGPRQIYTDEGSGYFTISQNVLENAGDNGMDIPNNGNAWYFAWTPTIHDNTIDDNYTDTSAPHDNGTNCPITNTHTEVLPWSADASAIIAKSGLEPQYREILPRLLQENAIDIPSGLHVELGDVVRPDSAPFVPDNSLSNFRELGLMGVSTVPPGKTIDLSKARHAAPDSVYNAEVWGSDLTFTFSNLKPNFPYRVRLHFVETERNAVGQRIFDVAINDVPVLTRFDIFKDCGGMNIADVKEFDTTADGLGQITVEAASTNPGDVEHAEMRGIEIFPGKSEPQK